MGSIELMQLEKDSILKEIEEVDSNEQENECDLIEEIMEIGSKEYTTV